MSTSSYVSSTSECAAIGLIDIDREKKEFFAYNFENLKLDIARGGGDYLMAFSKLSKCSESHRENYNQKLKSNYSTIFQSNFSISMEQEYFSIEKLIKADPILSLACKVSSEV